MVLDGVYQGTEGEPVFHEAGAPTRDALQELLARIFSILEVRRRLAEGGLDPVGGLPGAFAAIVKVEIVKMANVIKASGAKAESCVRFISRLLKASIASAKLSTARSRGRSGGARSGDQASMPASLVTANTASWTVLVPPVCVAGYDPALSAILNNAHSIPPAKDLPAFPRTR